MLQALREKSKKARESDEESIDDDLPDFDEFMKDLPSNRGRGSGTRGRPRGRGKRGNASVGGVPSRGRGRGRGRGRPALKTFQTSRTQSSKSPSDGKSKESGESSGPDDFDSNQMSNFPEIAPFSSTNLDQPKLIKLKLGNLIKLKSKDKVSKRSKSSKHHRKSSVDSKDGEVAKIPKLTIRLGPKPDSSKQKHSEPSEKDTTSKADGNNGTKVQDNSAISKILDSTSEIDGVCDKTGDNLKQSAERKDPSLRLSDDGISLQNSSDKTTTSNESNPIENPFALNSDDIDFIPRKVSSKSDTSNEKNISAASNSKQSPKVAPSMIKSSSKPSSSELDTIFGPSGIPLDMSSVIGTNQTTPKTSATASNETSITNAKDDEQEKSELDLIREELMKDKLDSSTPPQASPHADTAFGPLRKAINAARNSSNASSLLSSSSTMSSSLKTDTASQNLSSASSQINANIQGISSQNDSAKNASVSHGVDDPNLAATSDSNMMKMKFKDLKMKFKSAEFKPDPRKSPLSSSVHHQTPATLSNSDPSQRGGSSSLSSNAAAMGSSNNTSAMGGQPRSSGGGGYARMRKKELLNQYYGQDLYPAPVNGPNSMEVPPSLGGHSNMSGLPSSMLPTSSVYSTPDKYQRPVSFKMPKAVASVISVPTRADYQTQLEANLERKRKRDKGLTDANGGSGKGADGKGRKGKKGKGKQDDEDPEYKASHLKVSRMRDGDASDNSKAGKGGEGSTSNREVARPKTRGKPPKKCLAESPPHDEDRVGDMKAESMKFAAAIRAEFEFGHTSGRSSNSSTTGRSSTGPSSDSSPLNTPANSNSSASSSKTSKAKTSSLRDVRIPKDKNKRKRGADDTSIAPVVSKTPKIVIKFAKDSSKNTTSVASGKAATTIPNINANPEPNSDSKEAENNKNGVDASPFDFVENECTEAFRQAAQALPMVDGTVDGSAFSSMNNSPATPGTPISTDSNSSHTKLPKIKIKVPTA